MLFPRSLTPFVTHRLSLSSIDVLFIFLFSLQHESFFLAAGNLIFCSRKIISVQHGFFFDATMNYYLPMHRIFAQTLHSSPLRHKTLIYNIIQG